jgi:hypothetical protein
MAQNCDSDILEGLAIANRPSKPKTQCFLVGEIGSYRFYFLLNLQFK